MTSAEIKNKNLQTARGPSFSGANLRLVSGRVQKKRDPEKSTPFPFFILRNNQVFLSLQSCRTGWCRRPTMGNETLVFERKIAKSHGCFFHGILKTRFVYSFQHKRREKQWKTHTLNPANLPKESDPCVGGWEVTLFWGLYFFDP